MIRAIVLLVVVALVFGCGYLWERREERRVPGENTDAGEDGL